ncbi:MAG: 50S ribosomal protein L25 [Treponema sp.]|nr:50S ribosomal protein L25 [Treponema sp.]
MEQFVINAKTRTESGRRAAKKLRATGHIPAVAYDEKGESVMLDIDAAEFSKAWRSVTKTTLVNLKIDGKDNQAYIKDTEYDIKTDKNLHADFYIVSGTKPITVVLKIHYTGTPAGVLKGGYMVKHVPDVKLKALPQDIPQSIFVDVSKLDIGGKLSISDLNLGDKVQVLTKETSLIVTIAPPKR